MGLGRNLQRAACLTTIGRTIIWVYPARLDYSCCDNLCDWTTCKLVQKNKERIIDFFSDFEGCGCLLIILGIVGILTLIGIIK